MRTTQDDNDLTKYYHTAQVYKEVGHTLQLVRSAMYDEANHPQLKMDVDEQ